MQATAKTDKTTGANGDKVDADAYNHLRSDGLWADRVLGSTYSTLADVVTDLVAGEIVYVQAGSYAGGTISTESLWVVEPGTVFTSRVTVTGDGVVLMLGPDVELQGGLYIDAADDVAVWGGGWTTVLKSTASDLALNILNSPNTCQIHNVKLDGTNGATGGNTAAVTGDFHILSRIWSDLADTDGILVNGDRCTVKSCDVGRAGSVGIHLGSLSTRCIVRDCRVSSAGVDGIGVGGSSHVVIGNEVKNPGQDALDVSGDNCVVTQNRIEAGSGLAENNTGTGNTLDNLIASIP